MAKMKPVSIAVLGMGVLIAFFVSLITYGRLQQKAKMQPAKPPDTQSVAVAAFDLSWGTLLDASMIKMVPYLKESLPAGSFPQPGDLEGRTLLHPVRMQEPIFESMLAPVSVKGGGIAAVVTPKKRAMSVKVDKVIGISGFIHPGNRVDVLVTVNEEGKSPITKTVLENILVLAAGPDLEVNEVKQQTPSSVEVATLEVTPEEGEKLALSVTEGRIQLSLRNYADIDCVITKGATIPALLTSCRGRETAEGEKVILKPTISSVTLIKGSCVSELTF